MFKAMTDINTHEIIEAFMSPSVSFLGKGYIGSFSTEAVTTLTQFEADEQLVTGNMLPGVTYYNVEYGVFGAKLKQITISHPALIHGGFIIREELCSSGLSTTFYNDGRGYILEEVYDDFRNLNEVYKNLTVSKVNRIDLFNATKARFINNLQIGNRTEDVTSPNAYMDAGGETAQSFIGFKDDIITLASGDSNLIVDNDAEVIKPHNLTRGTKVDNSPSKIYDVKKEPIEPSANFLMDIALLGIAIKTIDEAVSKDLGSIVPSNTDNLSKYASDDSNSNDIDINQND